MTGRDVDEKIKIVVEANLGKLVEKYFTPIFFQNIKINQVKERLKRAHNLS